MASFFACKNKTEFFRDAIVFGYSNKERQILAILYSILREVISANDVNTFKTDQIYVLGKPRINFRLQKYIKQNRQQKFRY